MEGPSWACWGYSFTQLDKKNRVTRHKSTRRWLSDFFFVMMTFWLYYGRSGPSKVAICCIIASSTIVPTRMAKWSRVEPTETCGKRDLDTPSETGVKSSRVGVSFGSWFFWMDLSRWSGVLVEPSQVELSKGDDYEDDLTYVVLLDQMKFHSTCRVKWGMKTNELWSDP